MPIFLMHSAALSEVASKLTPKASKTSALPHFEDADLLPCLATFKSAPAKTNAAAVDMLKVPELSPPVPHVSTIISLGLSKSIFLAFCLITLAKEVISSTVSPFNLKATKNPAICASVALPDIISSIASSASSLSRFFPSTIFAIASLIIFYHLYYVFNDFAAAGSQDAFRMKLDSFDKMLFVPYCHYNITLCSCRNLQYRRDFQSSQRVVSACMKRAFKILKNSFFIVQYSRTFAVHCFSGFIHFAAKSLDDALVPQANPEYRDFFMINLYYVYGVSSILWA